MHKPVINFENIVIYGQDVDLSQSFLYCQGIKETGKRHNNHIRAHLHTSVYQLYLVKKGMASFITKDLTYTINEPCIITIPENTVHEVEHNDDYDGLVISIAYSLIERLFEESKIAFKPFETVHQIVSHENAVQLAEIFDLGDKLSQSCNDNSVIAPLSRISYVGLLLARLFKLLPKGKIYDSTWQKSTYYQYYSSFRKNIAASNRYNKTVIEYASELSITSIHLNRVCREIAGKSALEIIQSHFIQLAKRYLLFSSFTISEIAWLLQFKDQAYFSKYFKKAVGISPKVFRKKGGR